MGNHPTPAFSGYNLDQLILSEGGFGGGGSGSYYYTKIFGKGIITYNWYSGNYQYENGEIATYEQAMNQLYSNTRSNEISTISGSALFGYDYLYSLSINGKQRLAGSIGGEITGLNNGFFDVTNNAFAAVLATNGEVNVWGDNNTLSKLTTAFAGINGMAGFINGQNEFNWSNLTNAQRNKIAYNIQKELKANGQRVLTKEIKAGINRGFKSTNVKLGVVSGLLIAANVAINGEVRPSDVMNTLMTGIGLTGWGAPIAAGYFVVDILFDVSGKMDQYGPIYDF